MKRKIAIDSVVAELTAQQVREPKFKTPIHGYRAIWEELDRLSEAIWSDPFLLPEGLKMEVHARQVASQALRFLIDCC